MIVLQFYECDCTLWLCILLAFLHGQWLFFKNTQQGWAIVGARFLDTEEEVELAVVILDYGDCWGFFIVILGRALVLTQKDQCLSGSAALLFVLPAFLG